MIFYSHAKENDDGTRTPTKELKEHLTGVAHGIESRVYRRLNFDNFIISNSLLIALGICHDIGKYTEWFQDYLLNNNYRNNHKKSHALLSAIFAFHYVKLISANKDSLIPYIYYYCIKHHHGFLKSPTDQSNSSTQLLVSNNLKKQANNIIKRSKNEIESLIKSYFQDFDNFELSDKFFEYDERQLRKIARKIQRSGGNLNHYFLIVYFFSILIASDKIDAGDAKEDFCSVPIKSNMVDIYLKSKKNMLLGDIRNEAKAAIEQKISEIDIEKDRLFTITAPTGIGKTLSVFNFALKLKERIFLSQSYNPQIIYCLPFINIIEQSYKVINELFREKGVRILKHHQYTDIFSWDEFKSKDNPEEELSKKLLEVEDWQADIVVTTFVQFFHSIISKQNRMLKKFHRLAGAIIILDEVQNIKAEYWPLIGTVLYCLSNFLNSRIILMTATQPLLFETANKHIEIFQQNPIEYKKLLNNQETKYFFNQFKRTKLIPLIDTKNPLKNADEFYRIFCEKWNKSKSCLIVVNTIKRSIEIFEKLKKEKISPYIYYLSTNLAPIHRRYAIRRVGQLLKKSEKIILVSTQSIEAGVDLDFDMGFRDIGPLDSIIQVAGRINRNNRDGFEYAPLYIVNFKDDAQSIYGRITIRATRQILQSNKSHIVEDDYLNLIQEYYKQIVNVDNTSFDESIKLYEAMKMLRFTNTDESIETTIDDFKLIDDIKNNYVDLYIVLTKNAINTLNTFQNVYLPCKNIIEKKRIYLKIKSKFNQYKISVPFQVVKTVYNNSMGIKELIENKLYVVDKSSIGSFDDDKKNILYDHSTGFCRKEIRSETNVF